MGYVKSITSGCLTAVLAWAILTVSDAIDEYVIDTGTFIGAIVFFVMPIVLCIKYIVNYINDKPKIKNQILNFTGYIVTFTDLWWYIYTKIEYNEYIIRQISRTDWLDLNGIEYIFYGFSALMGYIILCILFHIVYIIIKKLRNRKRKSEIL